MPGTTFPGTVSRSITDYMGERLSVLAYGAKGDGITDDAPAINSAITKLTTLGGRDLYFPGGYTYLIKSPLVFPSGVSYMRCSGDGDGSLIKSGVVMPTGQGMFDVQGATRLIFRNFRTDANVTTSARLLYSQFNSDPMHSLLTTNSTFWVHGGASDITFDGVTIQHTGGYSILLDATTGFIDNVAMFNCLVENCRPHLFGLVSGDITGTDSGGRPNGYGSWTGGFHAQSDGSNYAVRNWSTYGCTFRRVTGNCLWQHAYALNRLHSNIRVVDNHFQDCCLDGVEMGAVSGGVVSDNTFRRIGYATFDDTSSSYPRYLLGKNATALDTTGRVRGINYKNNFFMSVNGGCMDLDGYSQASVEGNMCVMPTSTDPEYVEDQITVIGPNNSGTNECYGVNTNNSSNDAVAGTDINIDNNTFINMNAGAIRLFAARNCNVDNNRIDHPAAAAIAPITYGPIGSGTNQRATGNVISNNAINWPVTSPASVIQENASISPFVSTDKNWIVDNKLFGQLLYEFYKDPNSSSVVQRVQSSGASQLSDGSVNYTQREGFANGAVYRIYSQDGMANLPILVANLQDYSRAGTYRGNWASGTVYSLGDLVVYSSQRYYAVASSTGVQPGTDITKWTVVSPLWNISSNGLSGTGVISTGSRLTSGLDDCVETSTLYGDGFLALTDATYSDAAANVLGPSVALLKWDSTNSKWRQSISVSGGARVWSDFVGSLAISGTANQISVTTVGSAVTVALTNTVTVNGTASTASLTLSHGYVWSSEGYFSPGAQSTTINVPSGGATFGLGVAVGQAIYLAPWASTTGLNPPGGGYSGFAYAGASVASGDVFRYYNAATASWKTIDFSISGTGVSSISGTANQIFASSSTGSVTLSLPQNIATNSNVQFGSVDVTTVFQSTAGSGAAFQIANTLGTPFIVDASGNISCAGVVTSTAGLNITTTTAINSIQTSGGIKVTKSLEIVGASGTQVLTIDAGYIGSADGFFTPSTSQTAFNATNGGITVGLGIQVNGGLWMKSRTNSANVGNPSTGYGGFGYDTGSTYWVWNGSAYLSKDFSLIGGGVTSLTASTGLSVSGSTGAITITNTGVTSLSGSNITVSGSTGAVSISIPQSVATTANVTFNALQINSTATNAINTSGGIDCVAMFCSSSAANAINTNGGVESAAGFFLGATTMINSSGAFVGNGVNCNSGIAGTGFNIHGGGSGQSWTITISGSSFVITNYPSGTSVGTFTHLSFQGGILVTAS